MGLHKALDTKATEKVTSGLVATARYFKQPTASLYGTSIMAEPPSEDLVISQGVETALEFSNLNLCNIFSVYKFCQMKISPLAFKLISTPKNEPRVPSVIFELLF